MKLLHVHSTGGNERLRPYGLALSAVLGTQTGQIGS